MNDNTLKIFAFFHTDDTLRIIGGPEDKTTLPFTLNDVDKLLYDLLFATKIARTYVVEHKGHVIAQTAEGCMATYHQLAVMLNAKLKKEKIPNIANELTGIVVAIKKLVEIGDKDE
ncbi:hypothetical protein [Arcanobacterium buesumense]|uniref:Uncharacterized protein n=1 Tax=Arcanobacterium buesumense TaxID=2722751 RepID=A0A6H2ELT3_9ACTO|nr:hypothetical protein [Arcanobacterium buesumense]QJC22027.1 hypothetical protein HC352_05600 [Arcanobacterium buesumense]